jgi:exopolyphosphatase/guanosine-5'-triphosphate,3'-diphosphate pyrophosphatase
MPRARDTLLAVIDIGSNSGRLVVMRASDRGLLEVIADAHAPLRLIREIDAHGRLKPRAIERTIFMAEDFARIARSAGAIRTVVAATAAVREATNTQEVIREFGNRLGLDLRVVDGRREARLAFMGAVYGLPVEDGMVLDVGGGSLQIARFRQRRLVKSWSLPLGALRMSERFLAADPPTPKEVRKLRMHVVDELSKARIPRLRGREALIGTGGTIRNLSKIDARRSEYPIPTLQGYLLSRSRLQEVGDILISRRLSTRTQLPGLNIDRIDSIAGGSVVVEGAMDSLDSRNLIVSGQGLREGIALDSLGMALPSVTEVRRHSVVSLARRFSSWSADRAGRRAQIVDLLIRRIAPGAEDWIRELLYYAAYLLDIGRSIDYYRRHDHAAMIVRSTVLMGFTHREIAFLSGIVEAADDGRLNLKRYRMLLRQEDEDPIEGAAVLLAIADEIEQRLKPGAQGKVKCVARGGRILLESPALSAWSPRMIPERFRRAFGMELHVN